MQKTPIISNIMAADSKRILILFAHPALQRSRINGRLLQAVSDLEGVTVHDLYACYPDFDIDVSSEQDLLRDHDVIVLHHPFYWYSSPAILKQWQDLVLEYGFAFGSQGRELEGKALMSTLSTGGDQHVYQREGLHGHPLREFLVPFEKTAHLCHMDYLPPFVIQGTHKLTDEDIEDFARDYCEILDILRDGAVDRGTLLKYEHFNDALAAYRQEDSVD